MNESILFSFSTNWNKKLNCDYFTTIRASGRYQIGDKGLITLKAKPHCLGEIINKVEIDLSTYDKNKSGYDFIAYLDTGYDWNETLKIIDTMYGKRPDKIYYYLIKAVKETYQEATLL